MEPRLQRRVQRYGWDKASAYYDRYWAAQLRPAQDLLLQLAALSPGERVLDVACGTGLVTFRAARAVGPSGGLAATDISQEMVRAVAAEARRLGVKGEFRRADAEALDFADASFDAVLCSLGLMYVPDPQRALAEMRRVLVPAGRAVAAVWGTRANCGWADIFPIVERRVTSEVCPLFFQLGTGDALHMVFGLAGFRDVHVERISTVLHYPSADEAVGAAFLGGPVALAYSRFDETARDGAHAEYLESIADYRTTADGYDVPGEFVVARGVR
jgi:ubiquinone/menaquinone biosynthesis C-methylase UbiE